MKRVLRKFWEDETATVTVEVVMILPIMLWGYFGMFTLFEGFRSLNANTNAAYTISDLLSRETAAIDAAYISGLNTVQDVLTQSPQETILRVSVVSFDDGGTDAAVSTADDTWTLEWSHSTNTGDNVGAFTQDDVANKIVPFLPVMYNGENLIVVETWTAFVPFFNLTLSTLVDDSNEDVFQAFYFEGIAVTRPRFATQLCWLTCANTTS